MVTKNPKANDERDYEKKSKRYYSVRNSERTNKSNMKNFEDYDDE